ncbi:MAG TPA: hypothetical protein VI111_09185 [Thermoleophilaceae bacterium]
MSVGMPFELPELMGLDPEELERVAHRTEQWAGALENSFRDRMQSAEGGEGREAEFDQLHWEIASLFAIAGGYRLLLDYGKAVEPLNLAAHHLAATGSFYAHALAVCAGDHDSAWVGRLEEQAPPSNATESELLLLRLGWLDAGAGGGAEDVRGALREQLERATPGGYAEAGRLGIPLSSTMRVLEAVGAVDREQAGVEALTLPLHDLLTRAYEVTAAAMSDTWHWRRLMSSVLPVEPELAALGAVVMAVARRHGIDGEVMERVRVPPPARVPLLVGGRIVEASL